MEHSQPAGDEFARDDRRGGVRATVQELLDSLADIVVIQGVDVVDRLEPVHRDAAERRLLLDAAGGPMPLRPGPAELRATSVAGRARMPALVLAVADGIATLHVDVARAELGGRRRDDRHPLLVSVSGTPEGSDPAWTSLTADISAGGARIRARLKPGTRHKVRIGLPGLELALSAMVVRQDGEGTGLAFTELGSDVRRALERTILRARVQG